MTKLLLLEQTETQTRLAVIEDSRLVELFTEPRGGDVAIGDIYLGRVMNVLPGMRAAFVDIGLDKNGFLSLDDLPVPDEDASKIAKDAALKAGYELLVQIYKLPGGDKGPRLSGCISLPGHLLVLLPTLPYVGVSRRIEQKSERNRLEKLVKSRCPEGMGAIIRTACEGADELAIAEDIEALNRKWQHLSSHARYTKAPALICCADGLTEDAAQQALLPDVEALIVEDETLLGQLKSEKARLHRSETGLFALYRVDAQAEKLKDKRVWLPSGGFLVIDRTEAMTVIDVNSGKFVGKQSLDDTILTTNREAAIEIARQLRLRDIGGIIIIDFIDMATQDDRDQIQTCLADELKKDAARTNLLGFTRLGLMEMTRKKRRAPAPKESK